MRTISIDHQLVNRTRQNAPQVPLPTWVEVDTPDDEGTPRADPYHGSATEVRSAALDWLFQKQLVQRWLLCQLPGQRKSPLSKVGGPGELTAVVRAWKSGPHYHSTSLEIQVDSLLVLSGHYRKY